ncbi:MAG: hypothetical protein KA715_08600 [Xanthomonadaceae bacterium]|nr:hypothetical protein [Xanthomonadaceae bacterium]
MKTLTEFASVHLTRGLTLVTELTTAGKPPEEQQAALTETFKFEGDKLKHFTQALITIKEKSAQIKRVVVLTLSEGEAAPQGATQLEGHAYLAEYFPAPFNPNEKKADNRNERGGRDGKKGGKRGGGRGSRDDKRSSGKPAGTGKPAQTS